MGLFNEIKNKLKKSRDTATLIRSKENRIKLVVKKGEKSLPKIKLMKLLKTFPTID